MAWYSLQGTLNIDKMQPLLLILKLYFLFSTWRELQTALGAKVYLFFPTLILCKFLREFFTASLFLQTSKPKRTSRML